VPVTAKKALERRQRRWAESVGVAFDARGYVRDLASNLREPLSADALAAFMRGSELTPGRSRPGRMWSLCSSAALVVNVFSYWRERDTGPLFAALGLAREQATLRFEEPFPTGLAGDPPTVDVALCVPSGRVVAIESKFAEWLTRRPRNKAVLKPKYFPAGEAVWARSGLPLCQALADDMRDGTERFKQLHAAQLLKHALGLAARGTHDFVLCYLYYESATREAQTHRAELDWFTQRLSGELQLNVLTYQVLYAELRDSGQVDAGYLEYLRTRYFERA
jgi:hypothetical protein